MPNELHSRFPASRGYNSNLPPDFNHINRPYHTQSTTWGGQRTGGVPSTFPQGFLPTTTGVPCYTPNHLHAGNVLPPFGARPRPQVALGTSGYHTQSPTVNTLHGYRGPEGFQQQHGHPVHFNQPQFTVSPGVHAKPTIPSIQVAEKRARVKPSGKPTITALSDDPIPVNNRAQWEMYNHATQNPTNYALICPMRVEAGRPCGVLVPMDGFKDHLSSKHIVPFLDYQSKRHWFCPLPDSHGKICQSKPFPIGKNIRACPPTWSQYQLDYIMLHIFSNTHSDSLWGPRILWSPDGQWFPELSLEQVGRLPDIVCRYCKMRFSTPLGAVRSELTEHVKNFHSESTPIREQRDTQTLSAYTY